MIGCGSGRCIWGGGSACTAGYAPQLRTNTRWAPTLSHLPPYPPPHTLAITPVHPSHLRPHLMFSHPTHTQHMFLPPLTPFGAPRQTPHRRRWDTTASLRVRIIIMICSWTGFADSPRSQLLDHRRNRFGWTLGLKHLRETKRGEGCYLGTAPMCRCASL